jgi:DNA-binding FadR family transcriptional regulator
MDERLIQMQAMATRIACLRITAQHLKALGDSVEQAACLPARSAWDRKAAAHAEIYHLLAYLADDPEMTPILKGGTGFIHDLMTAVGPAADGMIASSRRRLLAHLRVGDADEAALEMEKHLRGLHYMWRLTRRSSHLGGG